MRNPTICVLACAASLSLFVNAGEPRCGCANRGVAPRILDGTTVPASQFPTVGEVGDASGVFCTGTLIAPNVVLCAAHCVANDNGTQSLGNTEGRFTVGGKTYRTKQIVIHPTYEGFQAEQDGQFDVSLLILDSAVPNVTPTPLYRKTPQVGTLLILAGFGEQGTGQNGGNGTYPSGGVINTGTTTLERVTQSFLHWTFSPGESDTAGGDSGGPAFIEEGGVKYIAGVTSGGSGGGFGNTSFDTRVDAVAAWIDSVIGTSGGSGPALVLSGPNASVNPALPGQTVLFTATGADGVQLNWDFGDGSTGSGTSVQHAFASAGTYVVTLTATQASTGQTSTTTLSQSVGTTPPPTTPGGGDNTPVAAGVRKKRFTIQFQNPDRSKFDISLQNSAFFAFDRFDFEDTFFEQEVQVFFGTENVDSVEIYGTNNPGEYGDGKLSWNYKRGLIRYQLKGEAVNDFLMDLGAENEDIETFVTIPFFVQVDGVRYGGAVPFSYKARADRSGTGK